MTIETWSLYVGTVVIFMSTPGPSHLLMVSVSMTNGFRRSLATAAGDLMANALQIVLAGMGLAAIVMKSAYGFAIVKWAGVTYLVWLGLRQILASFRGQGTIDNMQPATLKQLWFPGFVSSAANPKAIVFFAALFPQFLDLQKPLPAQIAILGATYIVIDGSFLSAYGKGASWVATRLKGRYKAWVDRAAGAGLIAAAVLLGLRSVQKV